MTTIVGVRRKDGEFFMGADSQLSSTGTVLGQLRKILTASEEKTGLTTLIGIAGSATSILAIEDLLDENAYSFDSTLGVYRAALSIHQSLREHHGMLVEEECLLAFESMQCQMLIANKHGMWVVLSSREVIPVDTYAAIGSGRELALGAIEALGTRDTHNNILRSLEIAVKYDKDTGGRLTVWGSTDGKPSRL